MTRIGRHAIAAAVADGAGSASHGGAGATIAVDVAIDRLRGLRPDAFGRDAGLALLDAVREAIEAEAAAQGLNPRDFAATLLAVLLRRGAGGEVDWFALHIGDGVIAGDFGDGLTLVSGSENGEFGNTTFFVTGADAVVRLRTYSGKVPAAAFALMTDGAAESLYHRGRSEVAPAVGSLFAWCREERPATFARALRTNVETVVASRTMDDAALAIVAIASTRSC